MSVIVFIICLISCIASIIGYLRRKYKWRSRFMQSNRKLNHYDKRSPYDIYTRDIDIDAPNPYNVYKLFVGQNKNSDYQQREHDYHWYRFVLPHVFSPWNLFFKKQAPSLVPHGCLLCNSKIVSQSFFHDKHFFRGFCGFFLLFLCFSLFIL